MITRSKAKMASNSDSVEFDINNQLGAVNTEDNTTPSEPSSVVESPEAVSYTHLHRVSTAHLLRLTHTLLYVMITANNFQIS